MILIQSKKLADYKFNKIGSFLIPHHNYILQHPKTIILLRVEKISSDYIIIGTGLAGLYSSLQASRYGTVTLVCKTGLIESNSYFAQGGIAAAVMPDDSTDIHYEDTIRTGRGLCSEEAVRILVEEGKERIEELLKLGMPFDTNNNKNLAAGLEGGHTKRRVLHAGGDSTGKEIIKFLHKLVVANPHIKVFENIFVYDLIVNNRSAYGAYGFCPASKKNYTFLAQNTIIASGGLAGLYERTTNPPVALGDGIYLAYKHGAELANMEMLQFHPTCFFPKGGSGYLISEAVRGEGAQLLNENKERFMPAIDPMAELAPRDLVSIAIYNQMKKFNTDHVYLNLEPIGAETVKTRFSNIYKEVLKSGIDITKELLPVSPAAHYTIGGIKTDLWGRTNIAHLYAVGEAASNGVHGANRLASNSLLECLVFGTRAVKSTFNAVVTRREFHPADRSFSLDETAKLNFEEKKIMIGKLLNDYAGMVRTQEGLSYAAAEIEKIEVGEKDEFYSTRLRMMKELGLLITLSALERKETRGVHMREDYPLENEAFKGEIIEQKGNDIKITLLD